MTDSQFELLKQKLRDYKNQFGKPLASSTLSRIQKFPTSAGTTPATGAMEEFTSGVQSSLQARREELASGLEEPGVTLPEKVLQTAGAGAGLGWDIVGEALKSFTPDFVKKTLGYAGEKLLQLNPQIQTGLEYLGQGLNVYNEFAKTHPRVARDVNSLVNILAYFIPTKGAKAGKVMAKEEIPVIGEIATAGVEKIASKPYQEALRVVTKTPEELSKGERAIAYQQERGVVKRGGLIQLYSKQPAFIPSATEEEMAKSVTGIVKEKGVTPFENIANVNVEVSKVNKSVMEGLKNSKDITTIFNTNQLKSYLGDVKESSRVVFGGDKTLESAYDSVIDTFMNIMENKPKTLESVLEARKTFDGIIKSKFPKLFDKVFNGGIGDNARWNAVMDVRMAANDFIAGKLPEGNIFKAQLKQETTMLRASKTIAEKASAGVNLGTLSRLGTFLSKHPTIEVIGGAGLIVGAGMWGGVIRDAIVNPIVVGMLIAGETFKLGKVVLTSDMAIKIYQNILTKGAKYLSTQESNAIKSLITTLGGIAGAGAGVVGVSEIKSQTEKKNQK